MARIQRGCLALGDITGYTKYLAGVELEHSQDVLADLMSVLVNQMRGLLHLAKLEGDAVFCYDHDGEADASMLVSMIDSCYFGFAQRLQFITRHTTCQCNACRLIPRLNVKFAVHHGEYIIHEVAGSRELVGRDVICAHRLLKNSVTRRTGLRGYALLTESCLKRFVLDPERLGLTAHTEDYDDVGTITAYIMNLEARWRAEQERRAVFVGPGEGLTLVEFDLPAPLAIVWDYLTSPSKRMLWQHDTQRVEQSNPMGIRGIGTTNHCVHGEFAVEEEILDWKPFRYYTERSTLQAGSGLMTVEFQPIGDGSRTRAAWRFLPDGGPEAIRMVQEQVLPALRQWFDVSLENLTGLLTAVQAEAAERARTPTD